MKNQSKYVFEWCGGMKSGLKMTKNQALNALNNWYSKNENWVFISVLNTETGLKDVFFQDWNLQHVSDIKV